MTPIAQNALHASEMLNRGVYALNAHSILIAGEPTLLFTRFLSRDFFSLDDVAWIWYFDRQGAIQTTGINFIQDLPYLAALLFAFQRFSVRNWGFGPSLQNPRNIFAPFKMTFPEKGRRSLKVLVDPFDTIYDNFNPNGRSTRVLGASTRSKKRDSSGVKLSNRDLVAKSTGRKNRESTKRWLLSTHTIF
jgi:hypothetical protein